MPTPEQIRIFNEASRAVEDAEAAYQTALLDMSIGAPVAPFILARATQALEAAKIALELSQAPLDQ